ncbi:MAG: P-type conjugative transfer protein TrbL [Allosphingosinicella sp.]|uniref:P-type conjugative transfer protein TrbL n=1 Tax=Allosphingosinicella sp. TaxID=2823234 RepID=UPI00392C2B84
MGDMNVIDRFMAAFIQYIDSGFGLLGGDVAFLSTVLIGIDVTLAGLFWAMGGEDDIIGRFLKKILYVGAFALILGSFSTLADVIFRSFAGLGITAGGGGMTADDLLRPGYVAGTGFEAARPLLDQVGELLGPIAFFDNFLTIAVLMIAWLFVIVAFFVLAIQLFITIIEFKLTTLAGFVLVPFALWNRTSFLAERVLGNVVCSGVKVMVLAVIVGIGSGFFDEFVRAAQGQETDLTQAMSLVLASLALFGLGIFGPSIASGLVAGAPQLGAGAAVGTAAAAVGTVAVGGGAAAAGARGVAGGAMGALRAGTAMGSAASTAYRLGQETSGSKSVGAGLGGVARAGVAAARDKASSAAGLGEAAERGRRAAFFAGSGSGGSSASASAGGGAQEPPAWARRLRSEQTARHHRHAALQAVREGDRGGAGANPDISEREE